MSTTADFVEYVKDQSGLHSRLTVRKMFGEYAIYVDGKVVALACDNSLFLKPTRSIPLGQARYPELPPYPGAKPYLVIDELLDEPDDLRRALMVTAEALPPPKEKTPAKRRNRK